MRTADRVAWAVLTSALVLRIAHVLTIRDYPLFDVLTLDSESYDTWAREIAAGQWARGRPFYQAPLYAYFLAGLHTVSGGSLLIPRLANALLGTVTVALVWRIGRREFGAVAGVLAAALCAFHGTFLFEEGKVMKTTLGVTLGTTCLFLLGEARVRWARGRGGGAGWWIAAGLVGASAALVRENYLLFVTAVIALAAWGSRRGGFRPALWLAAGVAAALVPSALHNFRYDHELLPITSQAGQNFYTGVHPGNPHGGYLVPDWVRRSPRFEEIDFAAEAERRAGHPLTPGRVSRMWFREGVRILADQPSLLPNLFVRKLGLLFHDFEIPDDEDIRFFRRYAPILRLPGPGFGVLAMLGLTGLAVAVARRRAPPELVLFVAVYSASVALFFVFSRYRLPLVAPLAVFGGYALHEATTALRNRDRRAIAAGAIGLALTGAVVFRPFDAAYSFANSHLSIGIAWEVRGEEPRALAEYRQGLALEPENAKLLRRAARIASELAVRGTAEADLVELLRRATAANPADAELPFRLGTHLGAEGRMEEAETAFREVLARGARPPGIHANLALALERLGRATEAREQAVLGLEQDPRDPVLLALLERLGPSPADP
jgi:4-amino-4-deoxy-L-arabinose transferase-like glycosyltransferase